MKKIFLGILVLLINIGLYAQKTVSNNEAISVAHTARQIMNTKGRAVIQKTNLRIDNIDRILWYEIQYDDGVIVLVSGHKSCTPILGIIDGGTKSTLDDTNNIACGMKVLLKSYSEIIEECYDNDSILEKNDDWNKYLSGSVKSKSSVGPLLHSMWGQNYSNDSVEMNAYNAFAPDSGCAEGQLCPAGCVAVALGQVMFYWQYPFFLTDNNIMFDWCNMADLLQVSDNLCFVDNKRAINELLEDCGEAVGMVYACSGSGARTFASVNALKDRYHYKSSVDSFSVMFPSIHGYSNTMYDKIFSNLDRKRPVIMKAADPYYGGHAFVCDGYKNNLIHINWGYNGECNGYFAFLDLNVFEFHLTSNYGIVYNIYPRINYQEGDNQLILSSFYTDYLPSDNSILPYRMVPSIANSLTSASASSPESWRTIPAGATAVYQAHEEVILQDGFEAEAGCEFEARIEPCALCDEAGNNMQGANLPEGMTSVGDQPDTTGGTVAYAVGQPQELPTDALYPNPTDGPLTMSTDGMAQAVFVYTLGGNPVGGWRMSALTETSLSIDVSALAPGTYLLSVATPTGTRTAKFIRR